MQLVPVPASPSALTPSGREGVVEILSFIFLAIHTTFEDKDCDNSEDEDEEGEWYNDCPDDDCRLCVHRLSLLSDLVFRMDIGGWSQMDFGSFGKCLMEASAGGRK
ncbi:uncharacterized protein AFUA_2G09430 [Aspergillus fumigatus Af293]|uniref:Uncharacterized protein n=2 Tax=Aspergillus fumigatus TaxID=746128 RepID=Q4X1M6_ASPFU|nr:hypothetical protein AFUA_2G09430 [Aspergillus fumigatus Af293]EAL93239.1 hypothetical protein AFUA_2G09430 [Aspergillus fumigatus Af293]EDP54473.1 hypothetical protein AFUB_025290 [Aspergillus fumigatus A1163]